MNTTVLRLFLPRYYYVTSRHDVLALEMLYLQEPIIVFERGDPLITIMVFIGMSEQGMTLKDRIHMLLFVANLLNPYPCWQTP